MMRVPGFSDFAGLTWAEAKQKLPFLAADSDGSDASAQTRFETLLEDAPKSLACMLNTVTAMKSIDLGGKSPLKVHSCDLS
jgi:hypothetical protein